MSNPHLKLPGSQKRITFYVSFFFIYIHTFSRSAEEAYQVEGRRALRLRGLSLSLSLRAVDDDINYTEISSCAYRSHVTAKRKRGYRSRGALQSTRRSPSTIEALGSRSIHESPRREDPSIQSSYNRRERERNLTYIEEIASRLGSLALSFSLSTDLTVKSIVIIIGRKHK